jgi:hypothetical protein
VGTVRIANSCLSSEGINVNLKYLLVPINHIEFKIIVKLPLGILIYNFSFSYIIEDD